MLAVANEDQMHEQGYPWRTKSRQEPPPKYSITIQSLCPLRKLALYCVTNALAQVARTEISCWISWISSSLDSRSICRETNGVSWRYARHWDLHGYIHVWLRRFRQWTYQLLCRLFQNFHLANNPRVSTLCSEICNVQCAKSAIGNWLTSQLLHHLVMTRHVVRHCCAVGSNLSNTDRTELQRNWQSSSTGWTRWAW